MPVLENSSKSTGGAALADGFGDRLWFEAWYEAFAPNAKRYPVALPGTDLQPELIEGPVKIMRMPFRFLQAPVNSHTPMYGWKLSQLPSVGEVSRGLSAAIEASGSSGVEVKLLLENGPTLQLLRALPSTGRWIVSAEEAEQSVLVDVNGEWERYRRTLSTKMIKTLNWQENKLRGLGRFAHTEVGQRPDWGTWFEHALALEAKGWKGQLGTAIQQRPNETHFYRTVAEAAARERRLRLVVLTLEERVIAFQLLVAEQNALFLLKIAYDEEFSRYSPGSILQRLILKDCFADPTVHLLNLGGTGEWKLRWSERTARLMSVRLAPAASLAGSLLRAEIAAKRLRARLLSS